MGYFREKCSVQTDFEIEKNLSRKYLAKNNSYPGKKIYLSRRLMLKNSYTVVCLEKNYINRGLGKKLLSKPNHPYPHSPIKGQMVVN